MASARTEMLHIFISAAGDDIRPGATGKPVPGYRATILDSAGERLPRRQRAGSRVIGPVGCRYLDDDRQREYVVNGWNVTGDTFVRDEDGYFYYQARTDNMIVSSGYNIGGPEVEAAIDEHPASRSRPWSPSRIRTAARSSARSSSCGTGVGRRRQQGQGDPGAT